MMRDAADVKPTDTDQATAMMAIIEEIAAGSQGLIRDWDLLPCAQKPLQDGGPEGLVTFYRHCMEWRGARATWIKGSLEAHGKKTLESEYGRFMATFRSLSWRDPDARHVCRVQ